MNHPLLTLFCLGLVAGFGVLVAVVVWAQNSLAGQNLRHYDAAERRGR